jgi:hypothetical protein
MLSVAKANLSIFPIFPRGWLQALRRMAWGNTMRTIQL